MDNIIKKNIFPNNTNKIMKVNIFCRSEEAMLKTGKSLSHNKNIFCSQRNLDLVQPKIIHHYCFAKEVCVITEYKPLVAIISKDVATLS